MSRDESEKPIEEARAIFRDVGSEELRDVRIELTKEDIEDTFLLLTTRQIIDEHFIQEHGEVDQRGYLRGESSTSLLLAKFRGPFQGALNSESGSSMPVTINYREVEVLGNVALLPFETANVVVDPADEPSVRASRLWCSQLVQTVADAFVQAGGRDNPNLRDRVTALKQ